MRNHRMQPFAPTWVRGILTGLLALLVCLCAQAEQSVASPPDLMKGEGPAANRAKPDWHLHCGEARGWVWTDKEGNREQARQILVTEVPLADPASAVLRAGDVILGVHGKRFGKDPINEFREASVPAKDAGEPFDIVVWRKGWTEARNVTFDPNVKIKGYSPPRIPGLTARGKRTARPVPDFTQGGERDDKHDWNLGPTGARGWMWGMRIRTDLARQILITKVEEGSPADGILKEGDVILGIGGEKFDSDARVAFGNAITEAEKEENKGILELTRWREGKTETVPLNIGVMGTYGPLAPMDCPKSKKILENACRYIAKKKIGEGIPGYVNALGLLASGDKQYLPMVREYAHSLNVDEVKGKMSSWNMCYMNLFLAEYYLATGDKEVLPKIREIAEYLVGGQSRVGTWGHSNAGPDGICVGYGAMCQPSLSCAVSLVLDRKCGINDPALDEAIRKSEVFFTTFVGRGNVPYGDGTPREVHDSNGRSSIGAILYDLLDNPEAYAFYARMTVASYGQREEGHTGNYWGMLWGPLGAMRAGPEAAAAFIREQQWFFELERRWDGGFMYQGGAAMSGPEHTTPGWDTTGARALMYAMSLQKLHVTGKGLKADKFLTGQELADTLEAGRGYSIWLREGLVDIDPWDELSSDALLKKLVTWSTPMRIRAAGALARKNDDFVPTFAEMLESDERDVILGGIYGLQYQGEKAAPAAEKLIALLKSDDQWIRFRAGCTLCAIGERVRVAAAPAALRAAMEDMPDDPREVNQTFMGFVLWGNGLNGAPNGLLSRSTDGVDNDLIVAAIRKVITNENAQTRSYVSHALQKMSFEELSPLWGELVWAMENPAPSGIMFSHDIRETSMHLLAKYRYKEVIPLCVTYIKNMKAWGAQKRINTIMDVLISYGTEAKSVLPELYEVRAFYKENLGPGKAMQFPQWATDGFFEGFDAGIKAIEASTETPTDLRSLKQYD